MPFSRQVAKRRLLLHKSMCNNTTLERAREDLKAQVFFSSSSSRALLGEKRERPCSSKPRGRVRPSSGVRLRACQSVYRQACVPGPSSGRQHREKGKGGSQSGSLQRLSLKTLGRARPHLRMPSGGQTDQRRARARAYEPRQGGRQGFHAVPGRQAAFTASSG